MAKTIVGLFNTREEAREVINELVNNGFSRESVSLMTRGEDKESWTTESTGDRDREGGTLEGAATGAAIGGGIGLVVGLVSLAIPGVGPIIAAGPLATALTGLGVGAAAGGLIGALANIGVPKEHADYYAEGVRRGGVLVTVSADDRKADRGAEIMRRYGAVDIDERATTWKKSGWTGRFDETAGPYADEDITRERGAYPTEGAHVRSSGARRTTVTGAQPTFTDDPVRYVDNWVTNSRYEGRDWTFVENDFRTDWERNRPGTWDRFKDKIRAEWERRVYASGSSRRR
ncbi:MAG: hypothetical protein EHM61_24175 [Acidobacteria bacterium]|nr:MAG: hypothetical protein EHM61_24175 [Acidobacteriota bacterium]